MGQMASESPTPLLTAAWSRAELSWGRLGAVGRDAMQQPPPAWQWIWQEGPLCSPGTGPRPAGHQKGMWTQKLSTWQKMTSQVNHEPSQSSAWAPGLCSHGEVTRMEAATIIHATGKNQQDGQTNTAEAQPRPRSWPCTLGKFTLWAPGPAQTPSTHPGLQVTPQ